MGRPPRLDRCPTIREYEDMVRRMRYEATRLPNIEKVLPLTVLVTGARIGEILMLTVPDVDEADSVLYVPTEKVRGKPKRVVPVPTWYIPIIESYIVRHTIGYKLFPISRTQAWRIVKRELGYHPHAFRHVYGMYLLYKGLDPETVRRILGHSSWDMIEYYVRTVKIDTRKRTPLEEIF